MTNVRGACFYAGAYSYPVSECEYSGAWLTPRLLHSEFAPNGQALSPITIGFVGGDMQGGALGAAVGSHDNA